MSNQGPPPNYQGPSGGRATGATGGGYNKFRCRNWQRENHPREYMLVDRADALCAHCQCEPRR